MLHLRLLVLTDGGIGFSFCVLRGERKIALFEYAKGDDCDPLFGIYLLSS